MAAAGNHDITSTQRAALATPLAVAALCADDQRRVAQARDDINDAYEGQRFDFLNAVGKIIVHRFWDGDAVTSQYHRPPPSHFRWQPPPLDPGPFAFIVLKPADASRVPSLRSACRP